MTEYEPGRSTHRQLQKFRLSTPSPGTPGEGRGEGVFRHLASLVLEITLTPTLSRSTGRGGDARAPKPIFLFHRGPGVIKKFIPTANKPAASQCLSVTALVKRLARQTTRREPPHQMPISPAVIPIPVENNQPGPGCPSRQY